MSYATIATIYRDSNINSRITACVASEGISKTPEQWVAERNWALAAQPGWAEAWESSLAAHPETPDYLPGADAAVITDAMILSAVQALVSS